MKVRVLDTTLRDGEQTPRVSLTPDEKLRIAIKLDSMGVNIIEAGSAITSPGEREGIKKITSEGLSAEICSFSRAVEGDIDAALECDVDSLHLVVPTSDLHIEHKLKKTREEVLQQAIDSTQYAVDHGLIVELSAEDSTRSDMDFLTQIFQEGIKTGAHRICACDTVGMLTPEKSFEFYGQLSKIGAPLSVHCHNDFGLAVANSLSGLRAGASQAHVTVNGIGERAGNASLEEVVVALHTLYQAPTDVDISMLYDVSRMVARINGVFLQPNKARVGENAFAHESGIHADGALKDRRNYELYDCEELGRGQLEFLETGRKITTGEYGGIKGFQHVFGKLDIAFKDDKEAREILDLVRFANVHTQKPLTEEELIFIAKYPAIAKKIMTVNP